MSLETKSKWIIYFIIGIMLVYIIPMGISFSFNNATEPFVYNSDDFNFVLGRTTLLSITTTMLITSQ